MQYKITDGDVGFDLRERIAEDRKRVARDIVSAEEALVRRMLTAWNFTLWGEPSVVRQPQPQQMDWQKPYTYMTWTIDIIGLTRAEDPTEGDCVIYVRTGDHLDDNGPEMSATEGVVRILYARRKKIWLR